MFANQDDGFEWFGGTVDCTHLISAFNGDDAFDWDEGYRGRGQFWFVIQDAAVGGSAFECDGGTTPEDGTPYATPTIYNLTIIGSGADGANAKNTPLINLRDNSGGFFYNSIITDGRGYAIQVEDLASGEDSRSRLENGDMAFTNNIWFSFTNGIADASTQQFLLDYLTTGANANAVVDPMFASVSRATDAKLDPRVKAGSPAFENLAAYPDEFFSAVNYKGAFDANNNWAKEWTAIEEQGYLASDPENIVNVTDGDIAPGQNVVWTSNNTYVLDGFVFVDDAATLTIEAGTVIKGKPGEGANASALIVAQGGKIFANGTVDRPIIFTALADDMSDPNDLTRDDRGLWGGLIILGKAGLNVAGGTENIEGIPVTEPRGIYGGTDDDDNSGVLRYVSVRHGGSNIGANNEINGVTFGGVGRGTVVDHVEVYANSDDGFEWFGGTVDSKHLVSAFNGDDAFDWDEGFRGRGQFWLVYQADDAGGSAFECDGGTTPEDGTPYATPTLYNLTVIGSGAEGSNAKNTPLLNLRDNSGGYFYNSIIMDGRGYAIQVEDLASGEDSRARLEAGEMAYQNNVWFAFTSGIADASKQQFLLDYLTTASNVNTVADPALKGISRAADRKFDPRPTATSPALTDVKALPDGDEFFERANYRGAFDQNDLWIKKWTVIDAAGYVADLPAGTIVVTDGDIQPGDNVRWTSNNTYVLDGFVFVDSTATLTIEAGTVVKGNPGEGANASALIVARGGKIYANGTQQRPIIFTALADDVNDPNDLTQEDRGLWGGLIILGNARLNVAGGIENIEGIPVTEPRGQYGGTNDADDSGVLTYLSVRHGGSNIGANNEINGVTFGGVGNGTVVEHIEVFANSDDGFEWFGGTVNTKYLVSAFNGDDAFDWDEGFRGKGQFWLVLQSATTGGSAFECDGGTTPEDGTPYAIPVLSNLTVIGSGAEGSNAKNTPLLNLSDNSGGKFYNSIIMDGRGYAIQVEDLASGEDSRARLEAGDMAFQNNIWFSFTSGIADASKQQFLLDYLTAAANVNEVVDPMLTSISRTEDRAFDPRPMSGSPAFSNVKDLGDAFFTPTTYRGAFNNGAGSNWLQDWTFIWDAGVVTSVEEEGVAGASTGAVVYPNPVASTATLRYSVESSGAVTVRVVNAAGSTVMTVASGVTVPAGTVEFSIPTSELSSGVYMVVVAGMNGTTSVPMMVVR